MGQRNGPKPIPSLVEYKTIRLKDRYSTPGGDKFKGANEIFEQGQRGDRVPNGKAASLSSPQLPPSLASYGGLHSFSQMAQFIPTICNQNILKRRPPLLPLSLPGLSSGQTPQESTAVRPFYRSSMPEAFISASSNLITSSSTAPLTSPGNLFHNQQIGIMSSPGLECIGKSGIELPKPTANSEPACVKSKMEKLPPIGRSHCTVHSTKCSCVHTKNSPNDKNSSKDKSVVKKDRTDLKKEPNTVVGRRKLKTSELSGPKSTRKADKKTGLKTKQRQKRETAVEAKKSMSSEKKQQTDSCDDEEESISSFVRRFRVHTHPSPRSNKSNNDNEVHCDHDECGEKKNALDYYHQDTSILHPPPGFLPAIKNPKAHPHGTSLLENLGERGFEDNMGWAKDGFLEDSALKRAILLRNRALYNTSSNNTAAVTPNNREAVCHNSIPCENYEIEPKDEVIEEVKEIRKPLEVFAEKMNGDTEGGSIRKSNERVERKLGRAQHIRSVTWQDVSPHLGPKETSLTRIETVSNQTRGKLNPIIEQSGKSSTCIAAQALRRLKKNRVQKHGDHTNCISTVPEAQPEDKSSTQLCIYNLPLVKLGGSQDLAISCGARTSKSLGTMSGKGATDMAGVLQDTAMLLTSSYPNFIKMFSLPTACKTRFPVKEQTGKERNFEGHIDGTKVKQRNHLETGLDGSKKEKPRNSLTNIKPK